VCVRYNCRSMSSAAEKTHSNAVEAVHMGALAVSALGLAVGLATRRADWVGMGVSLVLLLPPLRIATSVVGEAHAGRIRVAVMGIIALMVLFVSRRIS